MDVRTPEKPPEQLVREADFGPREPGGAAGRLLWAVALAWSVFQVWTASPLPFLTGVLLMDDTRSRAVHVAFAFVLGFAAYPAFARSRRDRVPAPDWALGALGAACCLFIVAFYREVSGHAGGTRTGTETAVAILGLLCLAEVTRRAIGLPLVLVAVAFGAYAFLGPWMPEVIAHRGVSLNRFVDHMWLTTEGVFGIAIGVSDTLIFLYVLFGALLDRAGGGLYFIRVSLALLGHLRGGPAKACVLSSALTGVVSGSSIANIVSSGVFTIPLMKRVGYTPEKAAAIETSSSINGQIMPPVMGAAAFLMTEFVGISYFEVVKHAALPAIISYVGLYYIVHVEALKARIPVLERAAASRGIRRALGFAAGVAAFCVASLAIWALLQGVVWLLGARAGWGIAALLVAAYVASLAIAARQPEAKDATDGDRIPPAWPTFLSGLQHMIPIAVLIWGLMVEQLSAQTAVLWAVAVQLGMISTQPLLRAWMRGYGGPRAALLTAGLRDLAEAFVACARGMASVAIAMASAGVIIGVVSLTGLGMQVTSIVVEVAGGNFFVMLLAAAMICVVLGMGLPTTANYLVVAVVMAPVLVEVAARNGLVVPLVAVHLFVFYFGLISGTTPPVAVDAYAGAAVARSDPLKTCVLSFWYSMRTAILPFVFLFNTELLLIGIEGPLHFALVLVASTLAITAFAAASLRFMLVRNRAWETVALLLVAFTLMRPGFWMDLVAPPFHVIPATAIAEHVRDLPAGALVRLLATGETFSGDLVEKTIALPVGPAGASGEARLRDHAGLELRERGGRVEVASVSRGSPARRAGLDRGWEIREAQVQAERPPKHLFYAPAFALLALVHVLQRRRARTEGAPA